APPSTLRQLAPSQPSSAMPPGPSAPAPNGPPMPSTMLLAAPPLIASVDGPVFDPGVGTTKITNMPLVKVVRPSGSVPVYWFTTAIAAPWMTLKLWCCTWSARAYSSTAVAGATPVCLKLPIGRLATGDVCPSADSDAVSAAAMSDIVGLAHAV